MDLKKDKNKNKKCPFFKEDCLKSNCKIYHEEFDRCEISLLALNLFKLMKELQSQQDR